MEVAIYEQGAFSGSSTDTCAWRVVSNHRGDIRQRPANEAFRIPVSWRRREYEAAVWGFCGLFLIICVYIHAKNFLMAYSPAASIFFGNKPTLFVLQPSKSSCPCSRMWAVDYDASISISVQGLLAALPIGELRACLCRLMLAIVFLRHCFPSFTCSQKGPIWW